MKNGDYEVFENKDVYYLIKELDSERMIFQVLEIVNKNNTYRYSDSSLGISKRDLIEDEKHIFPNGRSKSKYKNVLQVYDYFGPDFICDRSGKYNNDEDLFEELSTRYEIDIWELSGEKYRNYYFYLKDDITDIKALIIEDRKYIGYKTDAVSGVRFLNELSKLINLKEVTKIVGKNYKSGFILVVNYGNKTIILHGLGYGKVVNNKLKGTMYVLEKCGFKFTKSMIEESDFIFKK